MCILNTIFCAISFNRTQDLHYPKKSGKIVTTALPIKLCPQKLYQYHILEKVYCMQSFVRFHATESERELSEKFWEKWNSSSFYKDMCTQIASLFFLIKYILHKHFCEILSIRNPDQLIPKIP